MFRKLSLAREFFFIYVVCHLLRTLLLCECHVRGLMPTHYLLDIAHLTIPYADPRPQPLRHLHRRIIYLDVHTTEGYPHRVLQLCESDDSRLKTLMRWAQ